MPDWSGTRSLRGVMGASILLLVLAVVVRGVSPRPKAEPDEGPAEEARIEEPMQFLTSGAKLRVRELDSWVGEDARVQWRAHRARLFALEGCPALSDYLESSEGQRLQRLLTELRQGEREDALAALALIFQLARATRWEPGWRGSHNAERLAQLLRDWLRSWAQRAAEDPVLYEPALSAAVLYGSVMRRAYDAPMVGRNESAYERARSFLWELCGTGTRRRTPFGEALAGRHPRAAALLEGQEDFLLGFDEDATTRFPELDGKCGGK